MVAIKKTIHAHIVSADQKNPTQIGKVFSLLPSDYRGLINLPTINGTEVIGDMKAKELSLLSSRVDDYNEHELGADEDEGKYFVLVGADEEVAKVPECPLQMQHCIWYQKICRKKENRYPQ